MRGQQLRELREQRGVRAAWVAERMGLKHRQQINKIENKKDVSVDEFVAYLSALDIKPGDYLDNSMRDVAPFLPIVEKLRSLHPAVLEEATSLLTSLQQLSATLYAAEGRAVTNGTPSEPRNSETARTNQAQLTNHLLAGTVAPAAASPSGVNGESNVEKRRAGKVRGE